MCLLELSKILMYEIHYDDIKNKYGNNSRILFRDADNADDLNKSMTLCH